MEGTGNRKQGNIPFGVILDEEVDDIALSIDHVCGCRSEFRDGLRWVDEETRTTERVVGRERTCDLEFLRWLRLCLCLLGDYVRVRTRSDILRHPCNSQ